MVRAPPRIAAIVPCYRVRDHIIDVLSGLAPYVDRIVLVDDACPDGTAAHASRHAPPNLRILVHATNQGVGAATITGYRAALAEGADLLVKLDGDGQMDPAFIPALLAPLRAGTADYAKGNRLAPADRRAMPPSRILGNRLISALARRMTGYRHLADPMNGFTAITAESLARLKLEQLEPRFFFETDLLCHLARGRARIVDIPMPARYGSERSNLGLGHILRHFPLKIAARLVRRP